MRENIYKMSKKLLGNPEFCKKLAEKETFDDTYKFCESIQGGYTKEEFENFLDESVYKMEEIFEGMVNKFPEEKQEVFVRDFAKEFCGISETDFDILTGKLTPKQLSQVAGGKNSRVYNKIVASSLAALTFASPIQSAFASKDIANAKEISGNNKNQDKQENENKQQPGLFKRIWEKTKNFVWNNKGKITVGAAVLATLLLYGFDVKGLRTEIINPKAKKIGKDVKHIFVQEPNEKANRNKVKDEAINRYGEDNVKSISGPYDQRIENKCGKVKYDIELKNGEKATFSYTKNSVKKFDEEFSNDALDLNNYELEDNITKTKINNSSSWWGNIKEGITTIPVLGIAGTFIYKLSNTAIDAVSGFNSFTKPIKKLWDSRWTFKNMQKSIEKWYEKKLNELNSRELTVEESLQNLNELFSVVKGQSKAKETIRAQVNTILRDRDFYKRRGQQYKKCNIFYFIGPSGVGKSMIAKGLADFNVLSSSTPYYMSASSIDKKSSESYIEQLFGVNRSYYGYRNENSNGEATSLVQYIASNPNGVVVIDEYDKMWCEGLDEIFRTAMDKGEIEVRQQKIDCSNITFILTSNESIEAIRGDKPIEVEMDDGTTNLVSHDRSFINRVTRVQFENLSVENNMEIIKQEFEDTALSYWKDDEIAGIDIVLDDDCLRKMAIAVIETKRGARYIEELRKNLMRDVTKKIFNSSNDGNSGVSTYRGKQLFACFNDYDTNEKKHSFRLLTETERNSLVKKHVKVMKKYFESSALAYWKDKADIDIVLDDECLRKMALSIIATGNSPKYIEVVEENLMKDVAEKIYGTSDQDGSAKDSKYKGQKLLAYFNDYGMDEEKHGFTLLSEDEKRASDKKEENKVKIDNLDIESIEEQKSETDEEKNSEPTEEQKSETDEEKNSEPTEEQKSETDEEKNSEPTEEQKSETDEEKNSETTEEQKSETDEEKNSEPTEEQKSETDEEKNSEPTEEQKSKNDKNKVNPIDIKPLIPENKNRR